MPEMSKSVHGSGDEPAGVGPASEASWLGDLKVYAPDGTVWGWAERWRAQTIRGSVVVVIPRLHLAQRPVYRLVHVRGYRDVFAKCCFSGPGLTMVPFEIYGADFNFYKDGRPEIHQVVTALGGGMAEMTEIIRVATELLT